MKLRTVVKSSALVVSAAWGLAIENPWNFAQKLAERLRTSAVPVPNVLLHSLTKNRNVKKSEIFDLLHRGEFTKALETASPPGRRPTKVESVALKRAAEQKLELESDVPSVSTPFWFTAGSQPRVLHILTNSLPFTQSGYTLRSHRVLTSLQEIGIDIKAVTRFAYPVVIGHIPLDQEQRVNGVAYQQLLSWSYPRRRQERNDVAVRLIVDAAREFEATVLHTTTNYANALIVARAAQILGVPWVYEVRGELESTWVSRFPDSDQPAAFESEFYRLARDAETRSMKSANAVIALSEVSRRNLVRRGIDAEKIRVVPNAIEDEDLDRQFDKSKIRKHLGLGDGTIVGTVTSVVEYEGLDTLVRAVPMLPLDTTILIVGGGRSLPELEKLAASLGVSNRVIFAGRQPNDNIWKWYAALDAFVVPRKDTEVTRNVTPIKAVLAQALDVPVVASDLPAIREVTGGLAEYFPPGDVVGFTAAISRALETPKDPGLTRAWLADRTWSSNAKRYQDLYESLHHSGKDPQK